MPFRLDDGQPAYYHDLGTIAARSVTWAAPCPIRDCLRMDATWTSRVPPHPASFTEPVTPAPKYTVLCPLGHEEVW
jgi:hypothetical protein